MDKAVVDHLDPRPHHVDKGLTSAPQAREDEHVVSTGAGEPQRIDTGGAVAGGDNKALIEPELRPVTPQERYQLPSAPPLTTPPVHHIKRENARQYIAYALIGLLMVEVVGAGAMAWTQVLPFDELKDLIAIIFVPTVSTVGIVIAFYFSLGES